MSGDWLADGRAMAAAERILDSAAQLFVEKGIESTGMAEIAAAAGCSRATLYRYFENRTALHVAFVHREARTLGSDIAESVTEIVDPRRRLEAAIVATVRAVRETPTLAAWFSSADASIAGRIANSSDVVNGLGAAMLRGEDDADRARARWVVRVVLSLLTVPGADADDERTLVREFADMILAPKDVG